MSVLVVFQSLLQPDRIELCIKVFSFQVFGVKMWEKAKSKNSVDSGNWQL